MYSVLRSDRPQARNWGRGLTRIFSGVTSPAQTTRRSQTLCAAFTEICCPTIARASVRNGSPRRIRQTFGRERMIAAITASFLARARFARSQYSGFMQRKVDQQVLRLHAHDLVFVARQSEVDGAAGDVGPHQRRVVELHPEQGKNPTHASLL